MDSIVAANPLAHGRVISRKPLINRYLSLQEPNDLEPVVIERTNKESRSRKTVPVIVLEPYEESIISEDSNEGNASPDAVYEDISEDGDASLDVAYEDDDDNNDPEEAPSLANVTVSTRSGGRGRKERSEDYIRFSSRSKKRIDFFDGANFKNEGGRRGRRIDGRKRALDFFDRSSHVKEPVKSGDKEVAGEVKVEEPTSNSPTPISDELKKKYPLGRMIWGKIPCFDWWPGYISNHTCNEPKDPKDEGAEGEQVKVWLSWYAEKQISAVGMDKIAPFDDFTKWYNPLSMKGQYRKSVMLALKTAAKRCKVEFKSNPTEKKLLWVVTESNPTPVLIREREKDAAAATPSAPKKARKMSGGKKRRAKAKGRPKGEIYFTEYEHEIIDWACDGFLPTGPEGFWPSSEEQGALEEMVSPIERKGAAGGPKKKARSMVKKIVPFSAVHNGRYKMSEVCICCGDLELVTEHPLYEGGLCHECKDRFMLCCYMFDNDGTQMYCSVCSEGDDVFLCDGENCSKVFCKPCVRKLCGDEEEVMVADGQYWLCYMCNHGVGLLSPRKDWYIKLKELFYNDTEKEYTTRPIANPLDPEDRHPIRVLALFDGIGTGGLVLKELGISIGKYFASEVSQDAIDVSRVHHPEIVHIGDARDITDEQLEEWGPFDLLIGGSPCNDLSIVNPARKGIYGGSGMLFFEFYRILNLIKPNPGDNRAFFWLFENVVSMQPCDKRVICRFLRCNPVVVDAKEITPAHRARYFWGNLPGMNRPVTPYPGDPLTVQECLDPNCNREAQFTKMRTITTKGNSIKQGKAGRLPVRITDQNKDDVLWCTEMERLFGFPDHYTDVNNLGRCGRQALLGKAWSVPVIRHFLSPLKVYYTSNTTMVGSSSVSMVASTSCRARAPTVTEVTSSSTREDGTTSTAADGNPETPE